MRFFTSISQGFASTPFRNWRALHRSMGANSKATLAIFKLDDPLVAKRVNAERVRVFADRAFTGALTAPLGTLLLAWVGGSVAGWLLASIWFVVFSLLQANVAFHAYRYRTVQPLDADVQTQEQRLVWSSFLVGLVWGASVWVFSAVGQFDSYLLNLSILVGVAGISVMIMAPSRWASVLFFGGLLVSPLTHALAASGPLTIPTVVGIVIFFALLLQYSRVAGQQLERDLESTVRNEILADRLKMTLGAARQDWFDLNLQSETMAASAEHIKELVFESGGPNTSLQKWLSIIHPDDVRHVRNAVAHAVLHSGGAELEYRIRSGTDGWLWVRSVGQIVERDVGGKPLRIVGIHTDINARKGMDEKIRKLAFYDHLTQLPNRRLLQDRLQHAIACVASRAQRHGALMLLDMDNFKTLNDTWGHDVGDQFLVEVAKRLRNCVPEVDTVARLGGDEFVVILEDIEGDAFSHTERVATDILHVISQPYPLNLSVTPAASDAEQSYSYHCTSSIGIALFSDQAHSADELMKRADTAMYQAKAMGRNMFRFFDPEMQAEVAARAAVDNDLHHAVHNQEFILHYQAQVDVNGRITGAEALIRWQHPTRGLVSPLDFIAVAEASGVIKPIGQWVLETACGQLALWAAQADLAHLSLSVNISAVQFHSPDFVDHILRTLQTTGIRADKLKLEVTESLLLHNVDDVIGKMAILKAHGVGFSLDDFGTGYSSLAYLKILPLEQLKIDQSFVRDVLTDANDVAIIRIVVALAQSMGISVLAEGVELDAQRALLAANGCHAYQGYYFGRPVPVDEFERIVRAATTQ